MQNLLQRNLFFVKQHIGLFKAACNFDIYDPSTQQMDLTCREENLGVFTKIFRFTNYKVMTPFNIEIKSASGDLIMTIQRGSTFFGFTPVYVYDGNGATIGKFKPRFRVGGSKIEICDSQENVIAILKGNFIGWDFKFYKENIEIGHVNKKWAGIGKEMFTSADNYMLVIDETVSQNDPIRHLMLASVMCIDFLLKR
jgi:uncharacterized protein YxjI